MGTILPDSTPSYITLQIQGLSYKYNITKDPNADAKVHVRNEDAIDGGYVFSETDDWSGVPGGNIQKYYRFTYSDASRWGNGEIAVEGDGVVSDAVVTYNYKLDIDDNMMKCATTPLADPSCNGYAQALADYLKNLKTTPDINDPFYDEWVQANLENEVVIEEEEPEPEEDEEEEETLEKKLGNENSIDKIADAGKQAGMLAELAQVAKIDSYYSVEIQGGEYSETLVLQDAKISDNRRALRNFASDQRHKNMVRSQYDRD